MERLYLVLQSQILELFEAGKVKEVTIERVSLKKWYPVFLIDDEQLGQIACSIRVNKEHELRTWADLRLLAEFLKDKCGVEECRLNLKSTEDSE
ncbi:TPA: transcriptional repressor KorA [Salmonella enterica subsp. enterica serovar Saintpaul]|nr:transcriptional regulator [Salmonella enterica]ECW3817431.1 transcriptional regulator [Salmonella enterica]